jgi:hypothetical protein
MSGTCSLFGLLSDAKGEDESSLGLLPEYTVLQDLFCGLVVRVPGSIPGATRFSEKQ